MTSARADLGGVLLGPGVLRNEVDADAGLVHSRGAPGVVERWSVGTSWSAWPGTDTI